MKIHLRKSIFFGLTLILIWFCLSYFGSCYSTRARHCNIPPASSFFDHYVESVSFNTEDNIEIKAWWIVNRNSSNAVILLNGIGANRTGMVGRAKIYHDLGYNVLMPDLRGTGESGGDLITFGWHERLDLKACYDFLLERGFSEIGVHGNSLGAAAIAYSLSDAPKYSFIVMESVYDNIENALNNRLKAIHIPSIFSSALIAITEVRIEVKMDQLRPEDYVVQIKAPTLFFAGDLEQKVQKSETESVFSKIGTDTKRLHFFRGAKHENFMNRYREEYLEVLKSWIHQIKK